jgi:hypothetical protein
MLQELYLKYVKNNIHNLDTLDLFDILLKLGINYDDIENGEWVNNELCFTGYYLIIKFKNCYYTIVNTINDDDSYLEGYVKGWINKILEKRIKKYMKMKVSDHINKFNNIDQSIRYIRTSYITDNIIRKIKY